MDRRPLVLLMRLLFVAVVLASGIVQGGPQSQTLAQSNVTAQPSKYKPKAPPKGCQAGQMRCINNAMRKAAAIHNADRRAKAHHHGGN